MPAMSNMNGLGRRQIEVLQMMQHNEQRGIAGWWRGVTACPHPPSRMLCFMQGLEGRGLVRRVQDGRHCYHLTHAGHFYNRRG